MSLLRASPTDSLNTPLLGKIKKTPVNTASNGLGFNLAILSCSALPCHRWSLWLALRTRCLPAAPSPAILLPSVFVSRAALLYFPRLRHRDLVPAFEALQPSRPVQLEASRSPVPFCLEFRASALRPRWCVQPTSPYCCITLINHIEATASPSIGV